MAHRKLYLDLGGGVCGLTLYIISVVVLELSTLVHSTPSTLIKRPVQDEPDLGRAASGASINPPTCLRGFGSPSFSDCGVAYRAMEDDRVNELTVWYTLPESDSPFDPPPDGPEGSYLELPRLYAYGTCVISFVDSEMTLDVATKASIKASAAGIISQCVRLRHMGGTNYVGRIGQLEITVYELSFGPSLARERIEAAREALGTQCIVAYGAKGVRRSGGGAAPCTSPSTQTATSAPGYWRGHSQFPSAQQTFCLVGDDCRWGNECQPEVFVGTDISWGLPQSKFPSTAGSCVLST
ncbi:MAG: hypothetical protein M1827_001669 [Pycnora praestabilis]|nr:MAG: hypothetical protein M1827_001669 [Pycnora praestabilis]